MRIKNEFTACTDFPPALGCEIGAGILGFNSSGSNHFVLGLEIFRSFHRFAGVATTVAGKLEERTEGRTIFRPTGDNDDDDKASW